MGAKATRVTDQHTCPVSNHKGGPVLPPGSGNVRTNSLAQSRATDLIQCNGPPDVFVTGATTVKVNGKMAVRIEDKTAHGGTIGSSSSNVRIGGPRGGATLGNPDAWTKICATAAAGRNTGSSQQTAQNCGVESARQLVIAITGHDPGEEDLLGKSVEKGDADPEPSDIPWDPVESGAGGTNPASRQKILKDNGVTSSQQDQSAANLASAVAQGKGVITSNDAGQLWGNPKYNGGGHAVCVTGMEYDANGNLAWVVTNDTGVGECGRLVPGSDFLASLRTSRKMNVSDKPAVSPP
jgi:uncharacterized Zn-binding protein involved in type VI secretion